MSSRPDSCAEVWWVALAILLLASVSPRAAVAQSPPASCVRIAFGAWSPPLDWNGAGHADSVARSATRQRLARDSVFAGEASAGGRDEMQWFEEGGVRRLLLFPSWWPAGVMITFEGAPRDDGVTIAGPDTLVGRAEALVADASTPVSRARARVLRGVCPPP